MDSQKYQDWYDKAEKELNFAAKCFKNDDEHIDNDFICCHCQQAAEKYLKGFLLECNGTLPNKKGHDLVELCLESAKIDYDFNSYLKQFAVLSSYYIDTRYPSDFPIPVTTEETKIALQSILNIKDFIISKTLIRKKL